MSKGKTLKKVLTFALLTGALAGSGILLYKLIGLAGNNSIWGSPSNQESSSQSSTPSLSEDSQQTTSTEDSGNVISSSTASSDADNVETTPYLVGNKTDIYWYATSGVTTDLPYETYQCTIHDLPSSATDDSYKHLYMHCDDDSLDSWIQIYTYESGTKTVLQSPYDFVSGQTIYFQLLKGVESTVEFYKIPIWIYTYNYDINSVYSLVQFWIYPAS